MPYELDVEVSTGQVRAIQVQPTVLTPPSGLAAVAVAGGGTFAAGTYFWVVTFTNDRGETTASNEASAVIALNGSANLTWNNPPEGTTGVKVYRGTATGAENALIATLGAVAAFTDTGTAGTAATVPAINGAVSDPVDILTGDGYLFGWSIINLDPAHSAGFDVTDGDNLLASNHLANGVSDTRWFGPLGIRIMGSITFAPSFGDMKGAIYASYYRP